MSSGKSSAPAGEGRADDGDTMKELRWAMVAFRVAMGVTFLSPVADRFGLWGPPGAPNVSWGNWDRFVAYSTRLNWYLPDALQQAVAAMAVVLDGRTPGTDSTAASRP